jgi:hypothetical protein
MISAGSPKSSMTIFTNPKASVMSEKSAEYCSRDWSNRFSLFLKRLEFNLRIKNAIKKPAPSSINALIRLKIVELVSLNPKGLLMIKKQFSVSVAAETRAKKINWLTRTENSERYNNPNIRNDSDEKMVVWLIS